MKALAPFTAKLFSPLAPFTTLAAFILLDASLVPQQS
jgi:hypothetical protein